MEIDNVLAPTRTYCNITASSQKRALEEVALKLADSVDSITAEDIFSRLVSREKLGSTAIGHGIAIPHCRLEGCNEILGGLFTLKEPVDFMAFDDQPVNLLFVLLVPAEEVDEHLQVLAMLAKRFESASYRDHLSRATSDAELYQMAVADPEPKAIQAQR